MTKRYGFQALAFGLFTLISSYASPCTLVNNECPPGRIRNPPGLQYFQDIAYNSAQDYYLVVYKGDFNPLGLKLTPASGVGPEMSFGGNGLRVQEVVVEYNPDRDEYLIVWRYDSPLEVWARYLAGDATPIGNAFQIGSGGTDPRIAYSPVSRRYVVVFSAIGLGTHYRVIDGDSTVSTPLLGGTVVDGAGFSGRIAYASASNRFLISYVRDFSPPTRSEVWGILLDGDGFGFLSGVISIGGGVENQQGPEVGYASSTDQFMVAFEDWSVGGFPDVSYHFVSSAGGVSVRRNLTPGDPGWNLPGPIGFDAASSELIASYFNGVVSGYVREVKASTGALDRLVLFGNLNSNPLNMAIRPDASEPTAAVVWRNYLGEDGVHVSFVPLELPPPVITSTTLAGGGLGVAYSQAVPVSGGAPPLAFSLVSGTLPPGLSGPAASTGVISGTPTSIGNFAFRVRVQDAQGRFDEKDVTLAITLAPPTPLSPLTTTNNPRPNFQWTATPTATSYNLVVENLTDGGTPINQSGIVPTNYTPPVDLVSGKVYRWSVRATDGVNVSPFSQQVTFEVDSLRPSTVANLMGAPPVEAKLTGLTVVDSSGFQSGFGPEKTIDGNVTTLYASLGRASMMEEHITYDLGAHKSVGRVRLHSRDDFGTLMPRDFVFELSSSPTSGFTVAHTVTDFLAPATPGQWFTFNFTPVSGRYLRLRATKTNQHTNGLYYVTFNELEAWQTAPLGSVLLSWTAPGDDITTPGLGTVVSYDIRYTSGGVFVYGTATPVGTFPPPVPAGGTQTFLVTGLTAETVYRFGLTASDDAGNVSDVSNVAIASSKGFPPAAVNNLSASTPGLQTIQLAWNAPSDPPSGGAAASYEIRHSMAPITAENYDSATGVQGTIPNPAAPGTPQGMTVTGLNPNTLYYFALKSLDGGLNKSDISNVISFSTLDNVAPGAVTTLAVSVFDDDTADFTWNATGDDGTIGIATTFDLRYRSDVPITEGNFATSTPVAGEPAPGAFGTQHSISVPGLTPGTTYYFALKVIDDQNNASDLSNVVTVTLLADLAEPLMTSPAPGSTLAGSVQTFQWSANGLAATQWWLYVGTTQGARNIHDSGNLGPALSRTVTGIPTNGSTVWVRLWYFAGVWGYEDFQFTAQTPPPPPAITSPAAGSTLTGPSQLFQWTTNGAAVTEWWLYVGSTAGAKNYFDSGSLGAATLQVNVTGLPTNGSTVHARLWYRVAGLWSSRDFQYTAVTGPGPGNPAMTSPVPNSTLSGASVVFQWTANGAAVTEWWLYIGSSSGAKNLHDSGSLGTATQTLVAGLPTDGSQVFARLWYRIGGLWQFLDAQYTASNVAGGTPAITSPASGATLTGASQVVQWTANGAAVTEWWVYAGSTQGGKTYFDSGSIAGATLQVNVTGLPTNGSTIHVRLWFRISGLWQFVDAQYTAANLQPTITVPAPSSVLSGSSVQFQWVANGLAVTEWWLYAGSTVRGNNYYDSGSLGAGTLSNTATGLPTNGSTIHVTLWYRVAGLWQSSVFVYTAGP